ncbi:lecithin retinol acyltransferase-like [Gadus macrocephalus]|uniref:lecithin retinol acyltransferase-like n=1 Tax=Gadus macrocephalus TaxID=80720 RepID=UPI0028CBB46A|nr:lecithin retinol acyltransferase-like [Gadus macrocephalus]
MFPLHLLSLLFIAAQRPRGKEEGRASVQRSEEEAEGDLLFQRGDLLEVPRTLFTHFGIYLGGGYVAHLIPDILPMFSKDQGKIGQMVTNGRLILGVLVKCASVRVDSVEDFAYGSQILVNRMDQVYSRPPLGGEEVARRAENLRGSVRYSLLWYNCEHYVMYCRYGALVSFQTFQFCKTVRKMLLSRRVAKVTALLWASLLLYFRTVSACAVLPAITMPFIIWMAS